jgi:hypothetical protein
MESVDKVSESQETVEFMVHKCAICDGKVELIAGNVIFGDKWYHRSCWELENVK